MGGGASSKLGGELRVVRSQLGRGSEREGI